jgi:hypothetical protein
METTVADELISLGLRDDSDSHHALLQAARQGLIKDVRCAMGLDPSEVRHPGCLHPPELGGREYFESIPPLEWTPTADRFPKLGKDKGKYTASNVRLAHRLCNYVDYADAFGVPYDKLKATVRAATVAAELSRIDETIRRLERRRNWLVHALDR